MLVETSVIVCLASKRGVNKTIFAGTGSITHHCCIHSRKKKTNPDKAVEKDEKGQTAWPSRGQGPDKALIIGPTTWTSRTHIPGGGKEVKKERIERPRLSLPALVPPEMDPNLYSFQRRDQEKLAC